MSLTNPLARHDYPRRAALQRDLDRYYRECLRSSTARRYPTLDRRKEYCSGVAWKRVHEVGRYRDYFASYENPIHIPERYVLYGTLAVGVAAIAYALWPSSGGST